MTDSADQILRGVRRMLLWNNPEKFQDSLGLSKAQSLTMANANLAFGCVVGSWNYGLQHKDSDVDLKLGYWPTFEQFFDGRFPTVRVNNPKLDYTLEPVHQLFQNILKGNFSFVEMLYPLKEDYRWAQMTATSDAYTDELGCLLEQAKILVNGNARNLVSANLGSAKQARHRADITSDNQVWRKESAKAYRFVEAVRLNLVDNSLVGYREPKSLEYQRSVLAGEVAADDFEEEYTTLEAHVKDLASFMLDDLDQTHTDSYQRALRDYKWSLMSAVRSHTRDM